MSYLPMTVLSRTIGAVALIVAPFVLSAQSGARAATAAAAEWRVPTDAYYPEAGPAWARRAPAAVGLDSSALAARTTYRVPSWSAMLDGLAADIRERKRLA